MPEEELEKGPQDGEPLWFWKWKANHFSHFAADVKLTKRLTMGLLVTVVGAVVILVCQQLITG